MGTDDNVAALVNEERERSVFSLMRIKGITRKTAEALYEIDIRTCTDLIQYLTQHTNQELSRALKKQGAKVLPQTIKRWDWLGQARDLAQQTNTKTMPPEEKKVTKTLAQASPKKKKEWKQHAGFSVFFDSKMDEHKRQIWRTRVYHNESGDQNAIKNDEPEPVAQEDFSGTDTAPWVKWILARAKLPAAAESMTFESKMASEPFSTKTKATTTLVPIASYAAGIEILDVQVSSIPLGVQQKKLAVEIRFQVSGPEAKMLTTKRIPFRIEVHTVNLESGTSNLATSTSNRLHPQRFEYTSQQKFPLPDLGRYELHTIVLLLPPDETMVSHRGPIIKVVP